MQLTEYGFYIIIGDFVSFVFWRNLVNAILFIFVLVLLILFIRIMRRRKIEEKKITFSNSSSILHQWNGRSVITFPDLALYTGRLKNSLPHGKGLFKNNTSQPMKIKFDSGNSIRVRIFKTENGYDYELKEMMNSINVDMLPILKWLVIINCAALIFAMAKMPYGYYQILRVLTSITAGSLALLSYKLKKVKTLIISFLLVIMYNPMIPVHLSKDIWIAINLISVPILFFVYIINKHAGFTGDI